MPEPIRLEAAQLDLADAKISLPADQVADGMKRGKIAFTWKQLRSWLVPAVSPTASAHDGLVVTLPLSLVAPIFMARKKEQGTAQKRVIVDQKIPNLFFGFPQPEAPAPTAMQSSEVNARTGWKCPGAMARPTSAVKITSDITRGFSSAR